MNLNKRAMRYAKLNNYYKPSKIKKYLVLLDRKISNLQDDLKPSICPDCGSENTYIENSDEEYNSFDYMECEECGHGYEDDVFINNVMNIESFNYFDGIEMEVWSRDFKPCKGYKWFKKCDSEMDRMIKELSK